MAQRIDKGLARLFAEFNSDLSPTDRCAEFNRRFIRSDTGPTLDKIVDVCKRNDAAIARGAVNVAGGLASTAAEGINAAGNATTGAIRHDSEEETSMSTDDVDAKAREHRSRADPFYEKHGLGEAPPIGDREPLLEYRKRVLTPLKQHSTAWKDVDLSKLSEDALKVAETQIYADSAAAKPPTGVGTGMLREVIERDGTGRNISRFYGDPSACWDPFRLEPRYLTNIRTKF